MTGCKKSKSADRQNARSLTGPFRLPFATLSGRHMQMPPVFQRQPGSARGITNAKQNRRGWRPRHPVDAK